MYDPHWRDATPAVSDVASQLVGLMQPVDPRRGASAPLVRHERAFKRTKVVAAHRVISMPGVIAFQEG